MSFWIDKNLKEPLREYRWYMYFSDPALNDYNFALKACSKPEYKIDTSAHVLLNKTFNYPKTLVWTPIKVEMVSIFGKNIKKEQKTEDSNSLVLYNLLTNSEKLSKKSLSFSSVNIYQIDDNGNKIEEWSLNNSFITDVNFGSLNYESENIVKITFTIIYDNATLKLPEVEQEKIDAYISPGFPSGSSSQRVRGGTVEESINNLFGKKIF